MKLKTLKELSKKHSCPQCQAENKPKCIEYSCLKGEAIKYIKEYRYIDGVDLGGEEGDDTHYQIEWIKHFFNITEKDIRGVDSSAK